MEGIGSAAETVRSSRKRSNLKLLISGSQVRVLLHPP
jgi:hypothetical protein